MQVLSLLQDNYQWALSVLILLLYPKLVFLSLRVLDKTVGQREDSDRLQRVKWLLKTSLFVMILLGIMMIWGIELRGLLVIGSSLFALIGVALFASWSLLSNITSFLVLFIQNHCRIGSWVKIIDGGNFIEGRLVDMTLFNVVLETLDGNRVL
ncbi:MAG: mechanosensitive ion channel, partial [Vibrio metschnikovii]